MIIEKSELVHRIEKLESVVPKKPLMPALQGILLKDRSLIASDTEMTIKVKLEVSTDESFIIPEKAFKLIKNLPDGEVSISSDQNNTITIKMGKIKNTYQSFAPEEFAFSVADKAEGLSHVIDGEKFIKSVNRVFFAISDGESDKRMSSLFLQAKAGRLNIVGLDGHVISWDSMEYDGDFVAMIPKNTIKKLMSLGIDGDIAVGIFNTSAYFETDQYLINTRIVEGEYFNFSQMFSHALPIETAVDRVLFMGAITRAGLCTEDKVPVKLQLTGDETTVSLQGSTANYEETIGMEKAISEKMMISFNTRLLKDSLKAFSCEVVELRMASGKMPMQILTHECDLKVLVLPCATH